ncbi:hypothetical protein AMTRI_Chr05g60080 [Amborella trichopoda]|uniref:uncharacterized protein LOC110008063 isoform X2 n=1 Tax=Amborella trichopoda TaxID=13333 RepID=UPI0009BFE033|nr:uncharacterized protein LOC110008063 isoform X2 [Amborella trichopoda]|eukprot:XP_020528877.1 uncharacterized protein LOC110008063 isoform X2 [Amborella trichopoda]
MGGEAGSSSGGKKELRWKLLPEDYDCLGVKTAADGKFETVVYDENSPSKFAIKSFNSYGEACRANGVCRKNHPIALIRALNKRMIWRMEEVGEDERESGGERELGEKGKGVKKKKGLFQKIKDGFKKMLVFMSKKKED